MRGVPAWQGSPGPLLTAGTGVMVGCLVPGTDVFTLSEGLPGPWAAGSWQGKGSEILREENVTWSAP